MGLCCWLPLCVHKFVLIFLPFFAWWSLPIFAAVIVLCFVAFIFATSDSLPKIEVFETEKTFIDEDNERQKFPSLDEQATVDLSIIVPAYNEEERLPKMLEVV